MFSSAAFLGLALLAVEPAHQSLEVAAVPVHQQVMVSVKWATFSLTKC
jgi:hypothetical protein